MARELLGNTGSSFVSGEKGISEMAILFQKCVVRESKGANQGTSAWENARLSCADQLIKSAEEDMQSAEYAQSEMPWFVRWFTGSAKKQWVRQQEEARAHLATARRYVQFKDTENAISEVRTSIKLSVRADEALLAEENGVIGKETTSTKVLGATSVFLAVIGTAGAASTWAAGAAAFVCGTETTGGILAVMGFSTAAGAGAGYTTGAGMAGLRSIVNEESYHYPSGEKLQYTFAGATTGLLQGSFPFAIRTGMEWARPIEPGAGAQGTIQAIGKHAVELTPAAVTQGIISSAYTMVSGGDGGQIASSAAIGMAIPFAYSGLSVVMGLPANLKVLTWTDPAQPGQIGRVIFYDGMTRPYQVYSYTLPDQPAPNAVAPLLLEAAPPAATALVPLRSILGEWGYDPLFKVQPRGWDIPADSARAIVIASAARKLVVPAVMQKTISNAGSPSLGLPGACDGDMHGNMNKTEEYGLINLAAIGNGGGESDPTFVQTVSMNTRYHAGLKIFKKRCTDYEAIAGFLRQIFATDVGGIKTRFTTKSEVRVCDIGCGDGTVTAKLVEYLLDVVDGEVIVDVIEPVEEYRLLATAKLVALGSGRLKVNFVSMGAEEYFANAEMIYDLVFSSHSIYFFPLETILNIAPAINSGGFFVVVAMSSQSIMAELKDMFSPKPTITTDGVLSFIRQRNTRFQQSATYLPFPSVLTLNGITLPENKQNLTEEAKNLLSLMIQRNIDELDDADYKKVRQAIIRRNSGDRLALDNGGLLFKLE
ncbi:MAG: class I SAM-dependent methyltransferase [Pseudomonadota bacterium]